MAPATPVHGSFVMIGDTFKRKLIHRCNVQRITALHQTTPACSNSVMDCCDLFETDLLFAHFAAEHGAAGSNKIDAA